MFDFCSITEEVIPGNNPRPHLSYIEVSRLHYLDTGYFYCRFKGTTGKEDFENVTSTYLFVKSDESLFDSSTTFTFVNVPQYQV